MKGGGYTSFNSKADARALTLQNGRFNFHIGRELFYFQSYGMVLPSGAPYKGVFDVAWVLWSMPDLAMLHKLTRRFDN